MQEDSALFESWEEPEYPKYSGYYSPTFANLDSLWYRTTTDSKYADGRDYLDSLWNRECDKIIFKYINKYGPYFSAFEIDILNEIEKVMNQKIDEKRINFFYYIATKAHEIKEIENIWISKFEDECKKKVVCKLCKYEEFRIHQEPKIVRGSNANFIYCSNCYKRTLMYKSFWNDEIEQIYIQLVNLVNNKVLVNCNLCGVNFVHSPGIFRNVMHDFVYPNLFTTICGECFQKAYSDNWKSKKEILYHTLYKLFLYVGRIPTYEFYDYQYLFKDQESILQLFSFFIDLRSPEGFKKLDGSFYKTLINAGILKSNSRNKILGKVILSSDGHICFSNLEKEIDDFLFERGLNHLKDTQYPESNLLTNWKIEIDEKIIFIEYILQTDNDYFSDLIYKKKWIAKEYNIHLLCIYPKDDWKRKISECIDSI